MYLSHSELRELAPALISECSHPDHPFDLDAQTSVCSIDLRVGNVFWVLRRKKAPIDLGARTIFEVSPRRSWKKLVLEDNSHLDLHPGDMVLGRTYEYITMPEQYVGKINTRSSFARLGLSTACNCDLVNPGYDGHVPLELTNCTQGVLRIRPYLPLCQLFVMQVQGKPSSYSNAAFRSKYTKDDGGPSVWWRDLLVNKVSARCMVTQLSDRALEELRERFESIDDQGLYRLEKFIEDNKFSNTAELLSQWGKEEGRRARFYKIRRGISLWLFPSLVFLSLLQLQREEPDVISLVVWTLAALSLPFFLYYALRTQTQHYPDTTA